MLCNRYPAIQVCKKCAKMCRRAKQSPMDKSTTGFMAGFRTSEQTPFDIEMRFTMNKLLSCRFNMDTNRVEARFEDGTTVAIDCIAVEDEYGSSPRTAGRAGLAAVQQAAGVRTACAGRRDGALSLAGMRPRQTGRLSPYKEHDAHRPMVFAISWWASVVLVYNSLMVAVMGCMRIRLTGLYTASTTAASTTTTITARQPHGTCHAAPK